jgi:hypothetical protein
VELVAGDVVPLADEACQACFSASDREEEAAERSWMDPPAPFILVGRLVDLPPEPVAALVPARLGRASRPRPSSNYSPALRGRAIELRVQGLGYQRIADALGVSLTTAFRYASGAGAAA